MRSDCVHDSLARVLSDKGQNPEAGQHAEQSVASFRRLIALNPEPPPPDQTLRLAISLMHQAEIAHKLNEDARALAGFEEVDRLLAQLRESDSSWPIATEITAFNHRARGVMHWDADQPDAARDSFGAAIKLWNDLVEAGKSPRFSNNLAWFLVEVPVVELRDGGRAVQLATTLVESVPSNARHQALLGAALCAAREFSKAVPQLASVPETDRRARDWLFLAQAQWHLSRIEEARQSFAKGELAIAREGLDNSSLLRLRRETMELMKR